MAALTFFSLTPLGPSARDNRQKQAETRGRRETQGQKKVGRGRRGKGFGRGRKAGVRVVLGLKNYACGVHNWLLFLLVIVVPLS